MSSPVHHPQDLDAALMYAPPWARMANQSPVAISSAPPVESPPTSPQFENDEPAFDGDQAILASLRRLSLDPAIVPSPIVIDNSLRLDQMALRLCAVATVAALVAGAIASLPPRSGENNIVQAAAIPAVVPIPVKVRHASEASKAPLRQTALAASAMRASALGAMSEPVSQPVALAVVQQQQAADKPPALQEAEIATFIDSGKDQLMNGDISAARLLLRRAAEAGSAEAALALGLTFDPLVVGRLGAVGVQSDAAEAREWYQKAAQAGSRRAAQRLAKLAAAGQ
jgi:TPR repeat protein